MTATPSIAASVFELAIAGERAGFAIEQMIELLNAGLAVDTLLRLIEWKLSGPTPLQQSRWIV
jgi:hypothetical protein